MGGLVPPGDPAARAALRRLPETSGHPISRKEFHHYPRDEFLAEFYPDPADKAAIAAGMKQLRAEQRAFRLAEMRRRLGITQAQVAARMGITQGRVSAIEHAKPGTTELRTLAAYVEALSGRLEIIADFGDQLLAVIEPGTEAARPISARGLPGTPRSKANREILRVTHGPASASSRLRPAGRHRRAADCSQHQHEYSTTLLTTMGAPRP